MKNIMVILVILLSIFGCSSSPEAVFHTDSGPISFDIEVANTPQKRQVGLMNRVEMDSDKGMLFVFDEEQPRSFWMKNTLIELDMIFISKDKEVVSIIEMAEPCVTEHCYVFESKEPAMYVVEINGGLSEEFGIKPGVKVDFNRF